MNAFQRFLQTITCVTLLFTGIPLAIAESLQNVEIQDLLLARNHEFQEDVTRVSDNVYTVTGIGVQAVSMIVGTDGIVIIDTNVDVSSGEKILAKFREITDKPIKAIVFTHGHADHTGGAAAFVENGTQIWARDNFGAEDAPHEDAGITITRTRGMRHGGFFLPEDEIKHIGVVKKYIPKILPSGSNMAGAGPIKPTHTFEGPRQTLSIAGIDLELVAAKGETNDQLFVWYGAERVLFPGDNFYKSWPNLFTLRGTGYRDVQAWINSLSAMLEKQPHHLVAGHTRPIVGQENAIDVLTNYLNAVIYVFEKTIEGINKDLTPDQLVEYARLPAKYAELDYLRPYYGHPDWGVRSIYNGYLGWFDGNPTSLFPLTIMDEAQHIVDLAGGEKTVRKAMKKAEKNGRHQWALQLVDYLLALSPEDRSLQLRKADILEQRAKQTLNTTARNYYRSIALELRQAKSE